MVKKKSNRYASISIPQEMAVELDHIKDNHKGRFGSRAELVKFMINDFLGRNLGYKK